jgi:hypothetical protein
VSRRGGKNLKTDSYKLAQKEQNAKADLVDRLMALEDFENTVLPALQADLKAGMSSDQLREKYTAIVQAQLITTAISSQDVKARLAASKDILDRAEGTATQRIEQTHRLEKLPEDQLDAILKSELDGLDSDDEVAH